MGFESRFGKRLSWLATIVWTADMGKDRVVGRVGAWMNMPVLFLTFLGVYGVKLAWYWLLFTFVLTFFIIYVSGIIYVGIGMLKLEQELNNVNNPMLKEIHKKVCGTKDGP